MNYFKASLVLVALSLLVTVWAHPLMPEKIATHWNAAGQANGFAPPIWNFLIPVIALAILALLYALPKLDPLAKNFKGFMPIYQKFVLAITAFLVYLSLLSTAFNLGYVTDFNTYFAPAFAVLFWVAGVAMAQSKRNWFFGFRTPWTLSSDVVWKKTNELGGKLFKAFAVIFLLAGLTYPAGFLVPAIVLLVAGVLAITGYSYVLWKKENAKGRKR